MEGGEQILTTILEISSQYQNQSCKRLPGTTAWDSCLVAMGAFPSIGKGEHRSPEFHFRCTLAVH